ncbi:hypothetical protein J2X31_002356 [Flavobacterium arsenatis]|uniref:Transporter n=1 Tax=Flavobacterium arsenatis TaxID=1484332 RepID=A0ABU1TQX5_9FLAO|nr:outer membrane protein transport protein [Flavobacterium arsenatis]MDR6968339.1 hypothetical protein [Flavobacterium arsenatis]
MKKFLSLFIIGLSISSLQAQEFSDALRYSQTNLNGTARFRAMGGAFGALGGDFSAISVNPAGSAVFANNAVAITLSNYSTKNNSNYFGTTTSEKDNSFDLNQLGAVWVFRDYAETSKWKKMTLALTYENSNDFDNRIYSQGINPTNSVADYFISYANGIPEGTITNNNFERLSYAGQQAYLGYEGFFINPTVPGGNQYVSALTGTGNFYQENFISSTGYNGKLSFNAAAEYDERFYFGLNLNSHFVDFNQTTSFYEDYLDSPNHDSNTGVQASRFTNELYTYGTGFSFQLGTIAKITNEFRVGVAYESPTWYRLNDEQRQTLLVDCADCFDDTTSFYADPDLVVIYPTYRLNTPGKWTGSLAYVFGTQGLLSFDYSLKDYSNTKFKHSTDVNTQLSNLLDTTNEFRIGGEYRIKAWSLRAGYRFEESPYKNGTTMGDLTSYSGGFGYNFGDVKLDMSYTFAKRDFQQAFFAQGMIDTATINQKNNNISLTLLFEL